MTEPRVETVVDQSRPHWVHEGGARPVRVTLWEPQSPQPWPVLLLSHGTGGAAEDLSWIAEALAGAGFLVAGVSHHGNSYRDEYLADGFARVWERPRDLSVLLDWLVAQGTVDPTRVGAVGFSAGGYAVAALLGAQVNPWVLRAILAREIPLEPPPEFPDFLEVFTARHTPEELEAMIVDAGADVRDDRVRAGFLMAPAIAPLLDPRSLERAASPARIVWGEADDNTDPEANALLYLATMPGAAGHSVGSEIGHYEFIGDNPEGGAMREAVAREAVAFFVEELAPQTAA